MILESEKCTKNAQKMTQYLVLTELRNSNAIKIMKNSLTEQQNRIYSKQ